MPFLLQAVLTIAALIYLALVIRMIRRESALLEYSLIWLFLGFLGLGAALFPGWVFFISNTLGFETPVNLIYFSCVMFLMVVSMGYNVITSKQSVHIKELIQEVSLANERIRQIENLMLESKNPASEAEGSVEITNNNIS